jgi:hypothetical protein
VDTRIDAATRYLMEMVVTWVSMKGAVSQGFVSFLKSAELPIMLSCIRFTTVKYRLGDDTKTLLKFIVNV